MIGGDFPPEISISPSIDPKEFSDKKEWKIFHGRVKIP
jgi:hypothetical protein